VKYVFAAIAVIAICTVFANQDAFAQKSKICGDTLCSKVQACPKGQVLDKIALKCYPGSDGWKITGYYLPLEKEFFKDKLETVLVQGTKRNGSFDYAENNSTYYYKQFRSGFLKDLIVQGSGKTTESKILQTWVNDFVYPNGEKTRFYHFSKCAYTASGVCLPLSESSLSEPLVLVAVTKGKTDMNAGIIEHGTLLRIPDLPSPWNARTYWATDIGEWNDKHIDVFTGYGSKAKDDAYRITKLPPQESSKVLAVGFKNTR
jgi:hypothetical protein